MIIGVALSISLLISAAVIAEETGVLRAVTLDREKLAGVNLPVGETFIAPEDILEGEHRPRGEILHYGEELITEVYEDSPATFNISEPFPHDEYVLILSGKLILTGADGVSQEYVAGESLVVPKGFTGVWKMLGNFRELVVIARDAYEEAYGTGEE
jgi:uncharacterized cupin superfamily protein